MDPVPPMQIRTMPTKTPVGTPTKPAKGIPVGFVGSVSSALAKLSGSRICSGSPVYQNGRG